MVSSVHDYITKNDESQVKHWLSNTCDIDEFDQKRRTPIYAAVQSGNIAIAKMIIKKGCNVNIPNEDGLYPLQLAIYNKNMKLAELILTHKGDPNKQNPGGLNAISILCSLSSPDASQTKLLQLLLKNGGQMNATNLTGDTALHIAARNGSDELVQTLLANNASVDHLNLDGENALHCAVQSGRNKELVSRLLKLVSKLTTKTKEGKTALDLANEFNPKMVSIIEEARFQRVPWRETKPEGKWPIPRCNYSASEYNNRWYIYGGENDYSSSNTVYDDMHFFKGDTKEWRLLAPRGKEKPPPLCKHTSLIFGSKLYLFGGSSLDNTHNELWILDLDLMEWKLEKPEGPYLIRPRAGHTMTKISDTQFVVIGGSCSGDYFADIHVFDITTRIWERIKTLTPAPAKRHLHSAIFANRNIFMFGGCNDEESFKNVMMLELDSWGWYELEVRGTVPLPRSGHTALLVNNCAILYYGGMDSDGEILADIRAFDINTYTWLKYDSTSSNLRQPLHRAGHCMEIIGTSIYAFGGNSMFCMHELLPHILDNQILPVPADTVEEKKTIIKPPIPEKPVMAPTLTSSSGANDSEKLRSLLFDLISLTRAQDFASDHPLMMKCSEIEKELLEKEDKPPLPSKPGVPDKPGKPLLPPKTPEATGRITKRPPPSRQISMPSIVIEELSESLIGSGKASADIRKKFQPRTKPESPTPNRSSPTVTASRSSPTSNSSSPTPSTNVNHSSPTPNRSSPIVNRSSPNVRPAVPARNEGSPAPPPRSRGAQRGSRIGSPRGSPRGGMRGSPQLPRARGSRVGPAVPVRSTPGTRGNFPNLPGPKPQIQKSIDDLPCTRRISVHPTRPGRSQSEAPTLQAAAAAAAAADSLRTLRAPNISMGELPSLMIKEEEDDDQNITPSNEVQKLAHTQPTQYMLPPPPENPLQHFQGIKEKIPKRNRLVITDFKDKKDKQQYEITNEILTTEEGYLNDLAVLIGLFKKPLENEYEGCIPAHYLEVIFSNTENLFDLHLALFKDLLLAEKQQQNVGLSFMKVINLFPQYNNYCTNQLNAIETVQKLQKTNNSFIEFTKLMEAMGECNRQDIHSYLIKPFQRITRYPLLLKELLKQTSKTSKDYQHLEDSISRIDAIVKDANEEKRLNDSVIKLIEIQKSFAWQGEEGQLHFSPDCKFILEGKFKEWNTKAQKIAKRHFFLFNDMVVIAKEMGKKFKKLSTIPLDSCIIWDIKAGSSEIPKNVKFAFSIVRTDKSADGGRLIMCAKTKADKDNWINALNSAIALYI